MVEKSGLYLPNRIARVMLVTLSDLMGEHGLNAALHRAGLPEYQQLIPPDNMEKVFDFADYAAVCTGVTDTYGPRGAKVFMIRAGRAGFLNGIQGFIQQYGASLEATGKLVPLSIKLPLFLKWIARNYNETSDRLVEVKDAGNHYLYINKRCPVCWGRTVTAPDCHITLGFLQEAASFIAQGGQFQIRQISSISAGDPSCDFVIPKEPLE